MSNVWDRYDEFNGHIKVAAELFGSSARVPMALASVGASSEAFRSDLRAYVFGSARPRHEAKESGQITLARLVDPSGQRQRRAMSTRRARRATPAARRIDDPDPSDGRGSRELHLLES